MEIEQGPLPLDGEKVDPAAFLEAWISGTRVWNLPSGAFSGGTLQWVASQTDAPAAGERFAGMLWFKRGEGRLYMWDKPDLPSTLTFSDAGWIALSDRRELWCRAVGPVALGAACRFMNTNDSLATDLLTNNNQACDIEPNPRVIWYVESGSNTTDTGNLMPELILVAQETVQSGALFKAVELGFCSVLSASGESGSAGAIALDELMWGHFWRRDPTCGSGCRWMPLAQACDSSATAPAAEWLRPVFKHMAPLLGTAATV